MEHYIIRQIVEEMFNKAKKSYPSDAHTTLSNHIEAQSKPRISNKTAARAYKKYIDKEETDWSPNPESVTNFCKYLECDDYKDYVEKNIIHQPKGEEPKDENKQDTIEKDTSDAEGEEKIKKNKKWILTVKVTIAFALTITLYQSLIPLLQNKNDDTQPINDLSPTECMAWAKDHYEKTDCNIQLHPKFGTKVEPYDVSRSKMRKIKVNASFDFFSEETGQPLVWYYKTKKGELEYFTAPGIHPVNGETLKKVTEYIIQTYVPIHSTQHDSFISKDTEDTAISNVAVLILEEEKFDNELVSHIKNNYLSKTSSIRKLRDTTFYNRVFIDNFYPKQKLNNKLLITDSLILGQSKYNFSKDKDRKDLIICNLNADFSIYIKNNNLWKNVKTKTINSIGSGYTKQEAKANSIKKINYE